MKYLVAPSKEQQGKGKLDFCFTTPGEPLTIGFICRSRCTCGCDRVFWGVNSQKGTTVGVVAQIKETVSGMANRKATARTAAARNEEEILERIRLESARIRRLKQLICNVKVGTVLGIHLEENGEPLILVEEKDLED
jgi:hypothetical protein